MKKTLALCLMLAVGFSTTSVIAGDGEGKGKPKAQKTAAKKEKPAAAAKGQAKKAENAGKKGDGKVAAKKDEMQFNEGAPNSAVRWDKMTFDFGTVAYGSDVSHVFTFKNVSGAPVAVTNVGTSCGCTTPAYVKEPVAPGKNGTVTAKYDSTRVGNFTKTLTVDLNGESIILTITGNIAAPENQGGNN